MKIGEYEQMMAYLTRPGFKDGTEKIVEPPKSMQMDTTTSNPIPEYDINDFRNDAEIYILALNNNILPKDDIADKLNAFAQKGVDAGTFSMQDAGVMVRRLIGEVKDRAQKQRLRDVVPEGIGTVEREERAIGGGVIEGEDLGTRAGFNRPRLDVPGLEDEVKKLFNQGLSTNQVLKNLKEKPEFEKVSEGVVKRIKKEFNLGAKSADLLKSQADKYNKLKELVEQSNNQLKFVEMQTLREMVGLPKRKAPTDQANIEKFNVPKLDNAADKVRKGFLKIINNPNTPVEEVFDISTKIGKDTNLSPASVSQFLQDIPEYQDFKPVALKLQSPSFKGLIAGQGRTLADVMDIADQIPETTGTSLTGPNTPERFIINSVKRHIAQNGDKVEWVKAPGTFDELGKVTEGRSVFRYKGKDYSYLDLAQNGRNMKEFKEVYEMYDDMDELLSREVVNPVTNEKTTFKNLMNKAYAKGTGYETIKNPLEIDHFGSVKNEPFTNLRILPYRINRAAGTITKTARDAEKGFVTKQGDKWTPAKSKIYLQKSGYNFTKDINKLFDDEVKLANDILVKGRKLRTPVEIGVEAAEKKFKGLLDLEGVTTASKIDRPEAAVERDMFAAFNERISKIKNIPVKEVQEDVSKVTKLLNETSGTINSGVDPVFLAKYMKAQGEDIAAFGKKYGGDALNKIIKGTTALDLPIFQVAFASMQDWEEDSPLWVTLPAAFTDYTAKTFNLYEKTGGKAKEFGKFLASSFVPRFMRSPVFKAVSKFGKGASLAAPILELGQEAYKFEKQKEMLPEIARQFNIPIEKARKGFENYIRSTIPEDPAGQGLDELTVPESPGLEGIKRGFKQFGSLFGFTESPYKDPNAIKPETPESFKKVIETDDRQFLFGGGLASLFKKAAQVSDALRKVKNSTFSMFNNVRMFGNQKGIEKNLEGFTNIPEKNPKISALEDIQKLKATVPEKYHQDLDIMTRSVEQNNFETAWKEYQKFEKNLEPSLKFENIPEEYFPMTDPLNDAFIIQGPRDSFKTGRYQIRTSMDLDPETGKPTGKYQTEKYDTFDPETRTFRDEPVLVGASTEKGKKGLN